MYLFVDLYIFAELEVTVIFKRLPTWVRRNSETWFAVSLAKGGLTAESNQKVE